MSLQDTQTLSLKIACFTNVLDDSTDRSNEADIPAFEFGDVVPILRFLVILDVVN